MTAPDEYANRAPTKLFTLRQVVPLCALLLLGGPLPPGQTQTGARQAQTPADAALRALNQGNFDQVETLLRSATDPRSVAIRARALIERGRYGEAETLLGGPAAASPGSDAALELGRLQMYLGRRDDATSTLSRLMNAVRPATAAEYLRLGLAARELGQAQQANAFFRNAQRLAPDDPYVHTAWGELFLSRQNADDRAEALRSFQDALEADADHVPAQLGLARIALEENPPAARAALERASKTNPSYVPAHLLRAETALDERRRDDAHESIDRALAVNPNSLEARALVAAIAFLEDRLDDFETVARDVLAINPRYGEVFRVVGNHAARNYRFDEAAALVRRALEVDPNHVQAFADLGMHLMRTGDEPGARVALERAWDGDRSNGITKNLLEVLDVIDTFETFEVDDIVMRLHPEEAGVMREYALPLAQEALRTLSERYEFSVDGPILIEMFPRHDDFAVRNVGLPGMVGALGACFGRVVTLDSPRARPPGDFSWSETLWHEIAHVITLQMSNNRLPRWLSEGISVWEERRARPEWGREMVITFAQALNEDRILELASLNEGFSDPRTISLAYYQSSLVVEHFVETYGEAALRDLLRAYGRGLETDEALQAVFGATIAELQTSFDAKLEREYADLRRVLQRPEVQEVPTLEGMKALVASNPESFGLQMELARALDEAGDQAAAIAALERASHLIPGANGANNPQRRIAQIAADQGDTARAIEALEAVLRVDHSDVEAARRLVALLDPLDDPARAEDAYTRLVDIDPFDAQAQAALGRLALQRQDAGTAVRAFRAALATNPADRASAHLNLAEAYVGAGQSEEAKRETLAALEIAPAFERAQDLLLKLIDEGV